MSVFALIRLVLPQKVLPLTEYLQAAHVRLKKQSVPSVDLGGPQVRRLIRKTVHDLARREAVVDD